MTGETKRGESLHARRSHARQRAISRTHSIMIRSFACQNSQACSTGAKEERAGTSAISKTGLLNTAMRDNGGSGRKLSKTRKSGVSKFNILICHKPKVRFRVLDNFLPLPPLSLIAVLSKPVFEMAEV